MEGLGGDLSTWVDFRPAVTRLLCPVKLTVEKTRHFAVLSADLIANNVRTTASTLVEWLP